MELHLDVNVPQGGYANVEGSKEMGRLLRRIRYGETRAPPEFMKYILAKGVMLSQNLALHLAKLRHCWRRQRRWEMDEKNSTLVQEMPAAGAELEDDCITEFQEAHEKNTLVP